MPTGDVVSTALNACSLLFIFHLCRIKADLKFVLGYYVIGKLKVKLSNVLFISLLEEFLTEFQHIFNMLILDIVLEETFELPCGVEGASRTHWIGNCV